MLHIRINSMNVTPRSNDSEVKQNTNGVNMDRSADMCIHPPAGIIMGHYASQTVVDAFPTCRVQVLRTQ